MWKKWVTFGVSVVAAAALFFFLGADGLPAKNEEPSGAPEDNFGAEVLLPVEVLLQNPELPNGCEITALTMLLRHRGYDADKLAMADTYLSKEPLAAKGETHYCGDPEKVYCGDPASEDEGFYCFEGPIMEAGNRYLESQEAPYTVVGMTGAKESTITGLLDKGIPVMLWCTLEMDAPRRSSRSWICTDTGTAYIPYSNLHSVVAVGYSREYFYLNDPLRGLVTCERDKVMSAFMMMGSRAVIVI